MSGSGRMLQRQASSYREDDLRRAADWRRRQATMATPESMTVPVERSRPTLRAMLAAIGRRLPRFA